MDEQVSSNYAYVAWDGQTPYAAASRPAAPKAVDTTQVWLTTEPELHYWTSELSVTIYALRDAIAATGTRCAKAIRAYLERAGAP